MSSPATEIRGQPATIVGGMRVKPHKPIHHDEQAPADASPPNGDILDAIQGKDDPSVNLKQQHAPQVHGFPNVPKQSNHVQQHVRNQGGLKQPQSHGQSN